MDETNALREILVKTNSGLFLLRNMLDGMTAADECQIEGIAALCAGLSASIDRELLEFP